MLPQNASQPNHAASFTPAQIAAEQAGFMRKVYAIMAMGLGATGLTALLVAHSAAAQEDPALVHARKLLKTVPLIDGHNDIAEQLGEWVEVEGQDGDRHGGTECIEGATPARPPGLSSSCAQDYDRGLGGRTRDVRSPGPGEGSGAKRARYPTDRVGDADDDTLPTRPTPGRPPGTPRRANDERTACPPPGSARAGAVRAPGPGPPSAVA